MLQAVRDTSRQDVLDGLGQEDAVLAIDETGVIKKGDKSAGVARQYCGASGKIDNCQIGVFLGWQTAKGHALSRSGALPAPGVDRRARALSGGRHSRGRDVCDQTGVGPPDGGAGLRGRGLAAADGGCRD
jgi:DDE superfamily endonuclease